MVLIVPPVETSTTGRPLLAPDEVEHMLMDAVRGTCAHNTRMHTHHRWTSSSPVTLHLSSSTRCVRTTPFLVHANAQDGRAILTSQRLLWLPSNPARPSLSLLLVTLLAPELRASVSSLLTARKLTVGVLCAADGTPLPYGVLCVLCAV